MATPVTAFASITAAIVAAFKVSPALANGVVDGNLLRPLSAANTAAIVVRQGAAKAQPLGQCGIEWLTVWQIELHTRGTASAAGTDPATTVDQLLSSAWQRLAALDMASLGVRQVNNDPAIEWGFDTADTRSATALLSVQIDHVTTADTLLPLTA